MSRCEMCGYYYADFDGGMDVSLNYCHYEGPDAWAPCEQDEIYNANLEGGAYGFEDEVIEEPEDFVLEAIQKGVTDGQRSCSKFR